MPTAPRCRRSIVSISTSTTSRRCAARQRHLSWLLDLTAARWPKPTLDAYSGVVEDSRRSLDVNAAIDEAVSPRYHRGALCRFRSRKQHTFAEKDPSRMRHGFGAQGTPRPTPVPSADPGRRWTPTGHTDKIPTPVLRVVRHHRRSRPSAGDPALYISRSRLLPINFCFVG